MVYVCPFPHRPDLCEEHYSIVKIWLTGHPIRDKSVPYLLCVGFWWWEVDLVSNFTVFILWHGKFSRHEAKMSSLLKILCGIIGIWTLNYQNCGSKKKCWMLFNKVMVHSPSWEDLSSLERVATVGYCLSFSCSQTL